MSADDVRVVHAIPGRIRVKVPRLKNAPSTARDIVGRLTKLKGVTEVVANTATGSVTVCYDSGTGGAAKVIPGLSDTFGATLFPDVDPAEIHEHLTRPSNGSNGNGANSPPTVSGLVTGVLGGLDEGMGKVTAGALDLRSLLPLTLFGLGVAALLRPGSRPMPTWYDFIWFAFGTFVALNGNEGNAPP